MAATLIHLVRHGEVYNPKGILYGRLPGYHLSELGQRMAAAAAGELAGHPITALYASPLQRAQESAAPWSASFGLDIV
ncbi:MAG: histidine phosphatase family protein, partial [Candidatus Saccharibacteria bacterium]|nr:histidine phosphatase family protein [Microbacteriaceae bacterium]